jgi:hypothetical protein
MSACSNSDSVRQEYRQNDLLEPVWNFDLATEGGDFQPKLD